MLKIINKESFLLPTLKWLTIIFSIIALSSPIVENNIITNKNKGYDIALVLDTSGSMKEIGFDKNNRNIDKFATVQKIVSEFIDKRKNDNLALIVFGEFSFVASPLTYDKTILKDILVRLFIGIAGEKTAIIDSLVQTIKILSKSESKSKIAILLTDGRNTAGKIPYNVATKILEKHKIKIYTIGIGTERDYDKRLLVDIAKKSGGKFFSAHNSKVLNSIYEEIDKLEKSEIKSDKYIKKDYLYIYPLFVAIFSLIFYFLLKNRNFKF
jgi:Ca-activated chloride channel family protein